MRRLALLPLLAACDWLPLEDLGGAPGKGKEGETIETSEASVRLGISMSYHGILLDAENKPLDLDPQALLALQQELAAAMLEEAGNQKFDGSYKRIFSEPMDIDEQIVAHDAFIRTMLDLDEDLVGPYLSAAELLEVVSLDVAQFAEDFWEKHAALFELLRSEGIFVFDPVDPVAEGERYLEDCRAHDVPLPPDWPSDAWRFRSDLDPNIAFIRNDRIAVYTYEDPAVAGLCVALPRINGGDLGLMGIICQSASTGAACFWDNLDAQTRTRLSGALDRPMPMARLMNGDNLAENCTSCHRGENVFIVHPGTALDLRPTSSADAWYTPISVQGWENPPAFADRGSSSCSGCHAIGALGSSYCQILRHTADTTMPPGAPVGSSTTAGPYADDLRRLSESCGW